MKKIKLWFWYHFRANGMEKLSYDLAQKKKMIDRLYNLSLLMQAREFGQLFFRREKMFDEFPDTLPSGKIKPEN